MSNYEITEFQVDNRVYNAFVCIEDDSVWFTKDQMSILFSRDRTVITRHIYNLYK